MKSVPVDQQLYDQIKKEVQKRVTVWPSAYASGQLVTEYKKAFAKKYGSDNPYQTPRTKGLDRWFDEVWVNVCETDKNGDYLTCGRSRAKLASEDYPYCRPLHRVSPQTPRTVSEFTANELKEMCRYKRKLPQGIDKHPTRIYYRNVLQMGGAPRRDLILRPLSKSERSQSSKEFKKYAVDLPNGKTVYFGHTDYQDYTIHKDHERMNKYVTRHQKREDWTENGIGTPGFWSRWLLWNKPSFNDSLHDIENRFNVQISNMTDRRD
jgi:hypothetical protein